MTRVVITLFVFLNVTLAFCQTPSWAWAKEAFNNEVEFAKDVAVDPTNGDIVVVGDFTGDLSAYYGTNFVGALGGGFVAKYNSSGNLIWAFKIGENDNDRCHTVAIDASGNIYVAGYLTLNCDFHGNSGGSNILNSIGGRDAYIAKYDGAGMFQWVKQGGGVDDDEAESICLGASTVYITGYYHNAATFGILNTHSAENHDDIFLVAYDLNGNEQWLADAGATGNGYGYDVIADNNNVYVTGSLKGSLNIYNSSGTFVGSPATSGDWEGFTISFSNTGNYNWASMVSGGGINENYSITQNGAFVYITGSIQSNTNFTGYTANPVSPSGGGLDFFVAKLDTLNGNTQWVNCEPGNNDQEGMQIGIDGNSNLLVTGYFKSDITFTSGPTFTSLGNEDIFVVSYSTAGSFLWALQAGGVDSDIPYGIAGTGSIDSYVVGEYRKSASFGSNNLTFQDSRNIFVAKLGCTPITNNFISFPQTICEGSTPTNLAGSLPTGGISPYAFLWEQSTDNLTWSAAIGVNNLQNYSPPALSTNTYYRRTVTSSGGCASVSVSSSLLIAVDSIPTVANAGIDQTLCSTNSAFTGNVPLVGSGIWTLISGSGVITSPSSSTSTVTGLSIGPNIFQWTISNGVCLSSSDQVTISTDANPTIANAGIDQTICSSNSAFSGNIPLVGNGVWTLISGSGVITSPNSSTSTVTGLGIGANVFEWTISSGVCLSSSDQVTINADANPTVADAGIDQTLCSSNSAFVGNTPTVGSGVWTLFVGTGIIGNDTLPNSSISGLGIGQNIFIWTISNGTCPSSSDTIIINVDPLPTPANAGIDQTICSSNSAFTGNTPLSGNGNWSLYAGTGTIANSSSPTSAVSGLGVGQNIFVWTITSGVCPLSSDTTIINIDSFPTPANAGNDQVLCSSTYVFGGNVPAVGNGVWTLFAGTGSIANPSSATSSVSGLSAGQNVFVWTISNGTCPSSSDTVIINTFLPPTISTAGQDQTICSTSTAVVANNPIIGTGLWSLISGSGIIANPSIPSTAITGLSVGPNVFRWTISNGACLASYDDVVINVDANPTIANAGADKITYHINTILDANSPMVGIGTWSVISGSGNFANVHDPTTVVSGMQFGQNIFRWTISNGTCADSYDDVSITVNKLVVPNGFSPNEDGVNDFFEIPGLNEFTNVELRIFNRWGNLVYENSDYQNDWMGKNMNGEELSDDTYYYTMKIEGEQTFTGYVVIKRR